MADTITTHFYHLSERNFLAPIYSQIGISTMGEGHPSNRKLVLHITLAHSLYFYYILYIFIHTFIHNTGHFARYLLKTQVVHSVYKMNIKIDDSLAYRIRYLDGTSTYIYMNLMVARTVDLQGEKGSHKSHDNRVNVCLCIMTQIENMKVIINGFL